MWHNIKNSNPSYIDSQSRVLNYFQSDKSNHHLRAKRAGTMVFSMHPAVLLAHTFVFSAPYTPHLRTIRWWSFTSPAMPMSLVLFCWHEPPNTHARLKKHACEWKAVIGLRESQTFCSPNSMHLLHWGIGGIGPRVESQGDTMHWSHAHGTHYQVSFWSAFSSFFVCILRVCCFVLLTRYWGNRGNRTKTTDSKREW